MSKEKIDFKPMALPELIKKIDEFRAELFSLRLKAATEHVKDNSQFRKLRKNVARALTHLRQKLEQDNRIING